MRYFELLNLEHFILYLLPAAAFILVFTIGLAFSHFKRKDSEQRRTQIIESYPGGIEGRNAPFPLVLYLIIAGTVLWVLGYILFTGLMGVVI